jgi:molecular chaperone GrpE
MSGTTEKGNPAAEISAAPPATPPEAEVVVEVEPPAAPAPGETPAQEGGGAPGEDAEKASLRAQLELSQGLARGTMEKLREEHERYLRAAADLENYRKRAAREKEDLQRFAAERLVKDLLPAVDNLERALAAAAEGDPLTGGVRMVLKQVEGALARHGAEPQSALGQPFDPKVHEALMRVESAAHPPGTVVTEHGRAWTLRGRLIRPAMVAVTASPVPGGGAPGAGVEGAAAEVAVPGAAADGSSGGTAPGGTAPGSGGSAPGGAGPG